MVCHLVSTTHYPYQCWLKNYWHPIIAISRCDANTCATCSHVWLSQIPSDAMHHNTSQWTPAQARARPQVASCHYLTRSRLEITWHSFIANSPKIKIQKINKNKNSKLVWILGTCGQKTCLPFCARPPAKPNLTNWQSLSQPHFWH